MGTLASDGHNCVILHVMLSMEIVRIYIVCVFKLSLITGGILMYIVVVYKHIYRRLRDFRVSMGVLFKIFMRVS